MTRLRSFVLGAMILASPLGAQEKPRYQIGVLADRYTPESNAILGRLQEEIRAVVGEDAHLEFLPELRLFNDFDLNQARANYEQLASGEADLVMAFGYVSSLMLREREAFPLPTILFGATNLEIAQFDTESQPSGIPNFTYLIDVQSYAEDLEALRELTQFGNLGIAIEAKIAETLPVREAFQRILNGQNYRLLPFRSTQDILENLDGLDALYLAGGQLLPDSEIRELADSLIRRRIPSFTNTTVEDVSLGLLATNRNDQIIDQFLRRMALTVDAWVNGASLGELPVSIDFGRELTINYETARKIGLPINFSLIGKTKFLGSLENPTPGYRYSLLDIIQGGLERNLGLRSREKDVELSQQEVRQAQSDYLPEVSASASARMVEGDAAFAPLRPEYRTDGNLGLQQTVFSPDANLNIAVQRNLQLAEQSNLDASQLDAVLEGSGLYFNALLNKMNVRIQNQNLTLTRENLKIAEQNFQAGQAGKTDVLRFRSQMAQHTLTLVESINAMEQAYMDINRFLNNPIETDIEVNDAVMGEGVFAAYDYRQLADILENPQYREPFAAFLIGEARLNSPELESLSYAFKAVEKNYRRNALGRILPTVGFQASYDQNFNQWGQGSTDLDPAGFYSMGLNIRLPLFNQYKTELNRQSARIQMEQIEIDRQNLELAISRNVNQGVLNLMNQIANIKLSQVAETAARESLDLVQTSYREGAVNIIQLIDAQNNYLQAQLAQAGATYNFLITAIQLERFIGYNFLLHTEAENLDFRNRFQVYMENNPQD